MKGDFVYVDLETTGSSSPDRDIYSLLVQQLFSGAARAKIEIVQL
jgi:hypothetical protein